MIDRMYPSVISPRRARRGVGALMFVLFLSSIVTIIISSWQIDVARGRFQGEMRHLVEVVENEAYGLHYWLHDNPPAPGTTCPALGTPGSPVPVPPCGRVLSTTERTGLASHAATTPWGRAATFGNPDPTNRDRVIMARGWSIVHLIVDIGDRLNDGVIVLRPDDDVVARATWEESQALLDEIFGVEEGVAAAAADAVISNFNPARDHAVLASRFSRIDNQALLRKPHAGHPVLPMETSLDMSNGKLAPDRVLHKVLNVGHLHASVVETGSVSGPTAGELLINDLVLDPDDGLSINGAFNPRAAFAVTSLPPCPDPLIPGSEPCGKRLVKIDNDAVISNVLRVETATIAKLSTIENPSTPGQPPPPPARLTACVNQRADLCGGGDLEILDIKDGSILENVHVFGNTQINPALVTPTSTTSSTITTTIGGTGNFDEIEETSVDVRICFLSVTPLVIGAKC